MKNILKQRVHLWFPTIFESKGGIQTYSAFLLKAIQNLYPNISYSVFLKHDKSCSPDFINLAPTQFYCAGVVPLPLRTLLFATLLIGWGVWQCPQLIIATHLNFTPIAYWLKRFIHTPYWVIAHGSEAWDIKNPNLITALHHADLVLAVSKYTRDRLLQEQNLDPRKVVILPNTFDADRFQPAPKPRSLLERYGLKPEQPIILTVARLSEVERHKGYDRIIQAMPAILKEIPDAHYILVGKGGDLTRINSLIADLQLQDHVTLTGYIADRELCDFYNLCNVFAMPSNGEGFGIVYLEALGCGKPVLGGNLDGTVDALCNGKLGVLVNPNNVEEIAQILIEVLYGKYPNSLIYRPKDLRQEVIDIFGFERFQQTLNLYMASLE